MNFAKQKQVNELYCTAMIIASILWYMKSIKRRCFKAVSVMCLGEGTVHFFKLFKSVCARCLKMSGNENIFHFRETCRLRPIYVSIFAIIQRYYVLLISFYNVQNVNFKNVLSHVCLISNFCIYLDLDNITDCQQTGNRSLYDAAGADRNAPWALDGAISKATVA